jgi:hypothetical protein
MSVMAEPTQRLEGAPVELLEPAAFMSRLTFCLSSFARTSTLSTRIAACQTTWAMRLQTATRQHAC